MSLRLQRPMLLTSTLPESSLASPKRKRDTDDSADLALAPSPTRLRTTDLPARAALPDYKINGSLSPRTTVARHLQNLNLTGYGFDFEKIMEKSIISCTIADSQSPDFSSSQESIGSSVSLPINPSTSNTTLPMLDCTSKPKDLPLEIPETPRLQPTTTLSPVPSPIPRSKSPPPQNLWWADTEITGHDPTDPADDGYGINGVGFLPTPAMASARAERRKRQVTEWKNREAKEARQRRSEARRRRDFEMNDESRRVSEGGLGGGQQRRVRFLEV
ncbi:MAG: hypothetical protein L6R39_004465 [Caloplaca ligustica]|nr:MAG: hypothetical protein L6R39_004465 [Caloplaca ligustica]